MASTLEQIMVKMGFDTSESSKVTDAMNQVNQESRKAGEGMEYFSLKGREGHELMRKIGEQSPIMGSALKAAFSPEAAGVVALIAALGWVFNQFDKIREKIKQLGEASAQLWMDTVDAQSEAVKRVEDYQRQLDKASEALTRQNDKYKEQIELIDRILSGHMTVSAAIEDAAKKQTDADRRKRDEGMKAQEESAVSSARTPAEKETVRKRFEFQREQLEKQDAYEDALRERQSEKAKEDAKRRADQAKLEATHKELVQTGFEQAAASDAVEKAKKGLASAAAHGAVGKENDRAISELEEKIKDLTGRAADAKSLSQQGGFGGALSKAMYEAGVLKKGYEEGSFSKAMDENTVSGLEKQLADAQSEYKARIDQRDRLQAQGKNADEAAKEAAAAKERADAKAKQLNETKRNLSAQIAEEDKTNQQVDTVKVAELQRLRNDAYGRDTSLDFDSTLQQALAGQAGAKTDATRQYWQKIIDARMGMDRQLHPGLPDDPVKKVETDTAKEMTKQQVDYLKKILDALNGDDNR